MAQKLIDEWGGVVDGQDKKDINDNFTELYANPGADTTATAAELNYLDIATLGTGAASKAVVLDAGEDYTWPATGVLKVGVLQDVDGVALTATATELNLIDGSVAGTAVASKALVLGADKNVDMIAIADGGLALGAGAGTVVTATAAELNILDDVTATAAELNILDDICADISITYAPSATTDGIEVTFTVVDAAGVAIDTVHRLTWYISDDTDGGGLTAAVPDGDITNVAGVNFFPLEPKIHLISNTDLNGVLTVLVVDSANTPGQYFCVVNPVNGKIIVGDATVGTDYEGGS